MSLKKFRKLVGKALKEGGRKAKHSSKSIEQRLQETRSKRKAWEASNKLHREYKSEKRGLREAKLESYGLGKERRKELSKLVLGSGRKLSGSGRKRRGFKPPRIF